MGEIADMMNEGILCACCGVLLISEGEEESGVPEYCDDCAEDFA